MTIVICDNEVHENNSGVHVCRHIQNFVLEGQEVNLEFIKVDFTYEGENELQGYLCKSCASSINIGSDTALELGENKAEKAYALSSSLVCSHCFREAFKDA